MLAGLFFLLNLDLDLAFLKRTWTWNCSLKAIARLVTSLLHRLFCVDILLLVVYCQFPCLTNDQLTLYVIHSLVCESNRFSVSVK